MSPTTLPKHNFTCFSCSQPSDKPFAKINRGEFQYVMCEAKCLTVALNRLGIIVDGTRDFTSPVNITVRTSPFSAVNVTKSPLQRSPGSRMINTIEAKSDSDSDNDADQVRRLGEKFLNKKSPTPE